MNDSRRHLRQPRSRLAAAFFAIASLLLGGSIYDANSGIPVIRPLPELWFGTDCAADPAPTCPPPPVDRALQGSDPIARVSDNGLGDHIVRLTLQNPHAFSDNGSYAVTGVHGLNREWKITVIDRYTVDLQGSVYAGDYRQGGSIGFPYFAIGGFDDYDRVIIGVNGVEGVNGEDEGNHVISVGAASADRAGIAKVVVYLGGNKGILTKPSRNPRTGDYGYNFIPRSTEQMNGEAMVFADLYPVNGYVRRIQLPITLDTSANPAAALARPTYYVDSSTTGRDPSSCADVWAGGINDGSILHPFKTLYVALSCATFSSDAASGSGGAIVRCNPFSPLVEDYDLPNAYDGRFPDNVNARFITVTSGDPARSWRPTPALCRITRSNRYGLDDASAQYSLRANKVILDHVDLDMSKMTAITTKANGVNIPYLTLANCKVADPSGASGPLNGPYSYSEFLDSNSNTFFAYSSGVVGAMVECQTATQIVAGGMMYRNDKMFNTWDDFYFTTKNNTFAGGGEQGASSGFRSFNVQIDQPGNYYQRWHDAETLTVQTIKFYPRNNYTVLTYARPISQRGTVAIGVGGSPIFKLAGATTYGIGPGDYLRANGNWARILSINSATTGRLASNPASGLSGLSWSVSPTDDHFGAIYAQDVHFVTGRNGPPPGAGNVVSAADTGNAKHAFARRCDFHYLQQSSGANQRFAPAAIGATVPNTVKIHGNVATFSANSALFPNMAIVISSGPSAGETGTVAEIDGAVSEDGKTVMLTTSPGDVSTPEFWAASNGSAPQTVVQGDATRGCAGGVAGAGAPGTGAAPGDRLVVWGQLHADAMQFQAGLRSDGANFSNFYFQRYKVTGLTIQPLFPGGSVGASGTVKTEGALATLGQPAMLKKYDVIHITGNQDGQKHAYAIVAEDNGGGSTARLMAPFPRDLIAGSSWIQGKTTEGVAFVDCILTTEGRQGQVAQLDGGLVNWALIQSTFNVPHGAAPGGRDFWFRNASAGFGVAAFGALDSIFYNSIRDIAAPLNGAGAGAGYFGDGNCFVMITLRSVVGSDHSNCRSAVFDSAFRPTAGIATPVHRIRGRTGFDGEPLFPWAYDGEEIKAGGIIGAMQ